jgi:hypothetical protein
MRTVSPLAIGRTKTPVRRICSLSFDHSLAPRQNKSQLKELAQSGQRQKKTVMTTR